MKGPYLNLNDVEEMYEAVNGSREGMPGFISLAKEIATKSRGGAYVFKDEAQLFELFKQELPDRLAKKRISYFGQIVQLIS